VNLQGLVEQRLFGAVAFVGVVHPAGVNHRCAGAGAIPMWAVRWRHQPAFSGDSGGGFDGDWRSGPRVGRLPDGVVAVRSSVRPTAVSRRQQAGKHPERCIWAPVGPLSSPHCGRAT
jgi:hypothetical protein